MCFWVLLIEISSRKAVPEETVPFPALYTSTTKLQITSNEIDFLSVFYNRSDFTSRYFNSHRVLKLALTVGFRMGFGSSWLQHNSSQLASPTTTTIGTPLGVCRATSPQPPSLPPPPLPLAQHTAPHFFCSRLVVFVALSKCCGAVGWLLFFFWREPLHLSLSPSPRCRPAWGSLGGCVGSGG